MSRSCISLQILLLVASSAAAAQEPNSGCTAAVHNEFLSECALATNEARRIEQSPGVRDPWSILSTDFESESDLAGSFLAECYDLLDHPNRLPSRKRLSLKRAHMAASSAGCTRTAHIDWLRACELDALRLPGLSRKQLLEVFDQEGGISTRTQRSYIHPRCQNLKVRVTFREVGPEGPWGESEDDVVETATPYIGFFMAD